MAGAKDELDAIHRELIELRRDEFVAARTERVAQLRADGERKLAARVAKLRKPSIEAWAIDAAVRAHSKDAQALVDTAAHMQRSGSGRQLTKRFDQLVKDLAGAAQAALEDADEKVTSTRAASITAAIRAAALLPDPDEFLEARLVDAPSSSDDSLEAALRAGAAMAPRRTRTEPGDVRDDDDAEVETEAETGAARERERQAELRAERARLKSDLADARAAAKKSHMQLRTAERERTRAERELEQARAAEQEAAEADEHARRLVDEIIEERDALS